MALEYDAKLEGKVTRALGNDMRNMTNFYQSTRNFQSWDLHGIFLSKIEKI